MGGVPPHGRLNGRPVVVGEVLLDVFPDGSRRLGGAPFNVAWHLVALGLDPLLITRVGCDPAGDHVLREMTAWGLDPAGVQRDPERPTGEVRVRLDGGQPFFEIVADQAWDHLDGDIDLHDVVGEAPGLLYHGTLVSRTEPAGAAVRSLRHSSEAPVFLDVNLRPPWWDGDAVRRSLLGTRWVKLNEEELRLLSDRPVGSGLEAAVAALRFRETYALDAVIVTRGPAGAVVATSDRVIEQRSPAVARLEDPVGAGDAFSAVFVAGLMAGWRPEACLDRALELAAVICSVQGAVISDRSVYRRLLERWVERCG